MWAASLGESVVGAALATQLTILALVHISNDPFTQFEQVAGSLEASLRRNSRIRADARVLAAGYAAVGHPC